MSFSVFGVKISFEFGFFAAAAFFSMLDSFELGLSAVCGCIIHECGHIFAAVLSDVRIEKIVFWTGGVRIHKEKRIHSLSKDIFILLSGPLFNFAAALLYYKYGALSPFAVNLILGAFNLLPFSSLDGGTVISELLEYFGIAPDRLSKLIAVFSALLICLFLYFTGTGTVSSYGTILFLTICEFFY